VRAAVRVQLENLRPRRREPDGRTRKVANLTRSKAEQKFAATQKKAKQAVKEKEKSWLELNERVAKLKALRLAKEAADKEAAEQAAAEKAAAKKKRPVRSRQGR
jgi:peptidoglycan hydrolase CwlO-like protein